MSHIQEASAKTKQAIGVPSQHDAREVIESLDDRSRKALEALTPEQQAQVLEDLNPATVRNYSAVVWSRIRSMGLSNQVREPTRSAIIRPESTNSLLALAPAETSPGLSGLQSDMREVIEHLDGRAKKQLEALSTQEQEEVLQDLNLASVRNPSAVVCSRIQSLGFGDKVKEAARLNVMPSRPVSMNPAMPALPGAIPGRLGAPVTGRLGGGVPGRLGGGVQGRLGGASGAIPGMLNAWQPQGVDMNQTRTRSFGQAFGGMEEASGADGCTMHLNNIPPNLSEQDLTEQVQLLSGFKGMRFLKACPPLKKHASAIVTFDSVEACTWGIQTLDGHLGLEAKSTSDNAKRARLEHLD